MDAKQGRHNESTPVVYPVRRVALGAELEELQLRLARLRRETQAGETARLEGATVKKR